MFRPSQTKHERIFYKIRPSEAGRSNNFSRSNHHLLPLLQLNSIAFATNYHNNYPTTYHVIHHQQHPAPHVHAQSYQAVEYQGLCEARRCRSRTRCQQSARYVFSPHRCLHRAHSCYRWSHAAPRVQRWCCVGRYGLCLPQSSPKHPGQACSSTLSPYPFDGRELFPLDDEELFALAAHRRR